MDPLPEAIRRKIKNDDYVEFGDLVPKAVTSGAPPKSQAEGGQLLWELRPKRLLNQSQWWRAWDRYKDAFLEAFPAAARDMGIYGAYIRTLMDRADDLWFKYDEQFRRTRKSRGLPYCAIDKDLHWKLDVETPSSRRTSRGQGGSSGLGFRAKLPCFDYNANKCHFAHCRYGHFCSNCDGRHSAEDCRRTKRKEGQSKDPAANPKVPKLARRPGAGGSDRH